MNNTQHDFELDKQHQKALIAAVDAASLVLQQFPKNSMGLIASGVKENGIYEPAKKAYDSAFDALRKFNSVFVKKYKKELAAERATIRKMRGGYNYDYTITRISR